MLLDLIGQHLGGVVPLFCRKPRVVERDGIRRFEDPYRTADRLVDVAAHADQMSKRCIVAAADGVQRGVECTRVVVRDLQRLTARNGTQCAQACPERAEIQAGNGTKESGAGACLSLIVTLAEGEQIEVGVLGGLLADAIDAHAIAADRRLRES